MWKLYKKYWEAALSAGPLCVPSTNLATVIANSAQLQERKDTEPALHTASQDVGEKDEPSQSAFGSLEVYSSEPGSSTCPQEPTAPLEHLHQVFITKSSVLRTEVETVFRNIRHGDGANISGAFSVPGGAGIMAKKLRSLHHAADPVFPLFFTSQEWLACLDRTLEGECFLRQNRQRRQQYKKKEGDAHSVELSDEEDAEWDEECGGLASIDMYFDAEEDDSGGSDLDDEVVAEVEATTLIGAEHLNMEGGEARVGRVAGRRQGRAAAPRAPVLLDFGCSAKRALTYNIFVEKVWPKMNSVKQFLFHPYVHAPVTSSVMEACLFCHCEIFTPVSPLC
jgi:hypothetical protein